MTHKYKTGDVVRVINQTFSGRFFIEGYATIVKPIEGVEEYYKVCFKDGGQPPTCDRFIDPLAQGTPEEALNWITKINRTGTDEGEPTC